MRRNSAFSAFYTRLSTECKKLGFTAPQLPTVGPVHVLNLQGQELHDKVGREVFRALQHDRYFTSLLLDHNALSGRALAALHVLISKNYSVLQRISLRFNRLSEGDAQDLLRCIAQATHQREWHIDLEGNQVSLASLARLNGTNLTTDRLSTQFGLAISLVRSIKCLKDSPEWLLEKLCRSAKTLKYIPREVLHFKNELVNEAYAVLTGQLQYDSDKYPVGSLLFTDSLVAPLVAKTIVTAAEFTEVLAITHDDFNQILGAYRASCKSASLRQKAVTHHS